MKTKEITVENAFAWSKQVLLSKLKKDKGDYIVLDADIARTLEDPRTKYYEDAIGESLVEYIFEKKGVLDRTIRINVFVKGKKAGGVRSMIIGPVFSTDNTIETLKQDVVIPSVRKLVAEASRDFPFSDMEYVTCYIEELDASEE